MPTRCTGLERGQHLHPRHRCGNAVSLLVSATQARSSLCSAFLISPTVAGQLFQSMVEAKHGAWTAAIQGIACTRKGAANRARVQGRQTPGFATRTITSGGRTIGRRDATPTTVHYLLVTAQTCCRPFTVFTHRRCLCIWRECVVGGITVALSSQNAFTCLDQLITQPTAARLRRHPPTRRLDCFKSTTS